MKDNQQEEDMQPSAKKPRTSQNMRSKTVLSSPATKKGGGKVTNRIIIPAAANREGESHGKARKEDAENQTTREQPQAAGTEEKTTPATARPQPRRIIRAQDKVAEGPEERHDMQSQKTEKEEDGYAASADVSLTEPVSNTYSFVSCVAYDTIGNKRSY